MNMFKTIFLLVLSTLSWAAFSATSSATSLTGKDLLIAVVANRYPADMPTIGCEEFIPTFSKLKVDGRCIAFENKDPKIAFVGDSHMSHYGPSVMRNFGSLSPISIVQTGCFPFAEDAFLNRVLTDTTCVQKQQDLLAYLIKSPNIKTVVLSARWSRLMSGPDFDYGNERWLKMAGMSAEDRASFVKNGQYFIGALNKADKKVVLMRDVPDLDFDIGTCYNIRPVRLGKVQIRQNCSMAQAPFEPRRQLQNAVLDEVLKPFPQVKVYDPVPVFCQNGVCKASDGTLPYYHNADHVNNYGAELVFKDLVTKVFPELKP